MIIRPINFIFSGKSDIASRLRVLRLIKPEMLIGLSEY